MQYILSYAVKLQYHDFKAEIKRNSRTPKKAIIIKDNTENESKWIIIDEIDPNNIKDIKKILLDSMKFEIDSLINNGWYEVK